MNSAEARFGPIMRRVNNEIGHHSREILFAGAVVGLLFPVVVSNPYTIRLGALVFIYLLVGFGYDLQLNMTGLFTLGFVMYFALGGYIGALLSLHTSLSFWVVLPLAVFIAAVISAACHVPMLRFRGDYLCLVGLGFAEIVRLIATNWIPVTNGPMGLPGIPSPSLFGYVFSTAVPYYYLSGGLALLAAYYLHRLRYSQLGLVFRAIKENEAGAGACGVNVLQYKHLSLLLGAILPAIAGCVFVHLQAFVDPTIGRLNETTTFLTMVILSGGHPAGLLASTLVLTVLPELLREFQIWRMWILGGFLIVMMNLRPEGFSTGVIRHFQPRPRREGAQGAASHIWLGRSESECRAHGSKGEIEPILSVNGLTKRFGGVVAVNDVSFHVNRGEILALIGPNGAGKTTTFNMIAGTYPATSGEVVLDGMTISGMSAHKVAAVGIARTFQNINICGPMTVLDNVMVSLSDTCSTELSRVLVGRDRIKKGTENVDFAMSIIDYVGLGGRELVLGGALPYADQRRLEIARALARRPRILLADEPSAGMNPGEAADLMNLLNDIRAKGVTLLVIEHNMRVVMGISDRIVVLNYGIKIAEGQPGEIRSNKEVIKAYLGDKYETA